MLRAAVGRDGPSDSARTAEGWVERGFGGAKVKIGYPTAVQMLVCTEKYARRVIAWGTETMQCEKIWLQPSRAVVYPPPIRKAKRQIPDIVGTLK